MGAGRPCRRAPWSRAISCACARAILSLRICNYLRASYRSINPRSGETHEIDKGDDDVLHSGSTVRHGEASGVVIATGTHTYFGRTGQLVESARPQLHSEAVITRLVKWMCAIVGALVATTWVVSQARGIAPSETLPIALVLMM